MATNPRHIAVLGAGPIGIEAALEARHRGFTVTVYDSGRVGSHWRRFGHVTLFTPFRMNSTALGRRLLRESGGALPDPEALLTAGALADGYLAPLAACDLLRGSIREHARVAGVAREGLAKADGIVAAGDRRRHGARFLLRVESASGTATFEQADVVLDATGVYATPCATGPGGLPAAGEASLGDRIDRHIPDLCGAAGDRYRGSRTLLIGNGHSAATALLDLEALVRNGAGPTRVDWVVREAPAGKPFREVGDDPLPSRGDLVRRANAAAGSSWVTLHPGALVEAYDPAGEAVRAVLREPSGAHRTIEVDRVLALVGYRPDLSITRELQVHHCYASEAPMKLATALLASALESPAGAGDCLAQTSHGAESLRNPEPDFFVVGSKSYGRGSNFLLTIGHQQIRDVLSLIESETPDRTGAPSTVR